MKKLRNFLFALSLASIFEALPREAFGVELSQPDQQQINNGGRFGYSAGLVVWQSFTAGITGVLTEVDMRFLNEIHSSGRLRILTGEGLGGKELQTLIVPVESADAPWVSWAVNVPVVAGSQYTFSFSADAASPSDPWEIAFSGRFHRYGRGVMGIANPSDPSGTPIMDVTDADLVFRTFVSERPTRKPLPGTVVSWGSNGFRESIALAPPGLSGVVAVTGGEGHSIALRMDGTVVGWGTDEFEQRTPPPGLTGVVAIASGLFHNLALKSDGTVVSWGFGSTVPAGLSDVTAIAACGDYYWTDAVNDYFSQGYNLALKSDGTVAAWGDRSYGEVPVGLSNVIAIATGGAMGGGYGHLNGHSLALKSDGTVVGWGNDNDGESTPPDGLSSVVAIATGGYHSLALKSDGRVVAWGRNGSGQADVPNGLTNVVAIAAGYFHSLALKADGTVVAWGDSGQGQLEIPAGLTNVVAIAAGDYHSVALVADAPALAVQAGGGNISVSWPDWAKDFGLQFTTNLHDESSWILAPRAPETEGSFKRVTDSISGPPKFYRLKK